MILHVISFDSTALWTVHTTSTSDTILIFIFYNLTLAIVLLICSTCDADSLIISSAAPVISQDRTQDISTKTIISVIVTVRLCFCLVLQPLQSCFGARQGRQRQVKITQRGKRLAWVM